LWRLADGAGCRRRLHVDLLLPLPLREVECADLQQDANNRLKLVGGSSLRQVGWDYETLPPFAVFCSGGAGISVRSTWSTTRRSK
jgi:hypothetical protein